MIGVWIGQRVRALRIHKGLRQEDLARGAGVSRSKVSRVERGLLDNLPLGELERVVAALGGTLDVRVRWHGEQLDRLLDEAHARLVDVVVRLLRAAGWEVAVEVSFSIYGERGSIDILAFHRRTGILLVVEIKSVVPDNQAMLVALDRKVRLAVRIAAERGWEARSVARLLVVGASITSRRRVARLATTFDVAFPVRGQAVRAWLREPTGPISGLLFVSFAHGLRGRSQSLARQRVRRSSKGLRGPEHMLNAPPVRI